jgi:hypothetical protein
MMIPVTSGGSVGLKTGANIYAAVSLGTYGRGGTGT